MFAWRNSVRAILSRPLEEAIRLSELAASRTMQGDLFIHSRQPSRDRDLDCDPSVTEVLDSRPLFPFAPANIWAGHMVSLWCKRLRLALTRSRLAGCGGKEFD